MVADDPARGTFQDTWTEDRSEEAPPQLPLPSPSRATDADQGPCLYLGPSGQRCGRRALEGGYCASHRPGATSLPNVAVSKKTLAAIIGIATVLWPIISDIVREVVRWMHSH
jgi:hypothetical protein